MIQINKLTIAITANDCPNLRYQFDFSGFYNQNLARECVKLLKQKYDQGVSIHYLRIVSTAFVHYDNYLRKNKQSRKVSYPPSEKIRYSDYLNSLYSDENNRAFRRYINFLAYTPEKMNTKESHENE